MAKKSEILGLDGNVISNVPTLKDVKPCGSQVLVELLTAQEILGTKLLVEDSSTITGAPQGYIRALGPRVTPDWGFNINDRVTLHGNFTPLPESINRPNSHRPWILIEPNQIKAILIEN